VKSRPRTPFCSIYSQKMPRGNIFAIYLDALLLSATLMTAAKARQSNNDRVTKTKIQHVIVIVGENRSFDEVFATYVPPAGQTVWNLLSEGIVNADGTPGPNFANAAQYQATLEAPRTYTISPSAKTQYSTLPPPTTYSFPEPTPTAPSDTNPPPFATVAAAAAAEPSLLPQDIPLLTTGAMELPANVVDTRIKNVYNLPSGPYQLTPSLAYDAYSGDPAHRFYQSWQQADCNAAYATGANPSGCLSDLYAWLETQTNEGAISLGFYNVSQGDAPYLTQLAQQYTVADNYHQPIMGGSGANGVMVGTADLLWYSNGNGQPAVPPSWTIENPNPAPNTNNTYTNDSYSVSYTECSDVTQPGVASIVNYLSSLPYHPAPNCEPGYYYAVNSLGAPAYYGNGARNTSSSAMPPSSVRTIGDELLQYNISWSYYGGDFNRYLTDPNLTSPLDKYCPFCNFVQYSTSLMTNPYVRKNNLADVTDLYEDIQANTLQAVSFVKPDGFVDGHPASSKVDLFEAFVRKILDELQAQPALWATTAVFITVDESGGYYDSGYIQPLDFFGDGPRIPLIVVSPFSTGGRVVHTYYDHTSILKFIEYNWNLPPLTDRSRDNLPNPIMDPMHPYVPLNQPSIGDLAEMFNSDVFMNSESLEPMGGALTQITVGADGSVWGINASQQIYEFTNAEWINTPGSLTQIAAGSAGSVWGINNANQSYRWNSATGQWVNVPGELNQIAVGADGDTWGINDQSSIYHFDAATQAWTQVPGQLASISVGSAGAVYGLNSSGAIFWYNPGTGYFQYIPGTFGFTQISVGVDGDLWAVQGNIAYHYDLLHNAMTPSSQSIAQVAVGSGNNVFGLSSAGSIFEWDAQFQTWSQIPGTLSSIAVGANGSVWGLNSAQQIYFLTGQPMTTFQNLSQVAGHVDQFSIGVDGAAFGLKGGTVEYFNRGLQMFEAMAGAPSLAQISTGAGANLWGVDASGNIFEYNPDSGTWNNIPGELNFLQVGADQSVWGINAAGSTYTYNRNAASWIQIPGQLRTLSVGSDGAVWGINAQQQIYRFDASQQEWTNVPGALVQISVGNAGNVWGVSAEQHVYYYNNALRSWSMIPGALLVQVSVGFDGPVWGVNAEGSLYQWNWSTQSFAWVANSVTAVSVANAASVWAINASTGAVYCWF
jgi:phospholipase C